MYVPVIKSQIKRHVSSAGGSNVVVSFGHVKLQGSSVVGSDGSAVVVVVVVVVVVASAHEEDGSRLQVLDAADQVHKQSPSQGGGVVEGKS